MAISAVIFAIVSVGMYVLCANAHIDIFECEIVERNVNATPDYNGDLPLVKRTGSCSVLDTTRPPYDGEHSELTGLGWAIVVAFCGSIGAVAGGVAYVIARPRKQA